MTRDEAIEQVRGTAAAMNASSEICPVLFVESLVALGILKLDEPKSAREKFIEIMNRQNYSEASMGMVEALKAFDEATL